jgi:hypothetical protein
MRTTDGWELEWRVVSSETLWKSLVTGRYIRVARLFRSHTSQDAFLNRDPNRISSIPSWDAERSGQHTTPVSRKSCLQKAIQNSIAYVISGPHWMFYLIANGQSVVHNERGASYSTALHLIECRKSYGGSS